MSPNYIAGFTIIEAIIYMIAIFDGTWFFAYIEGHGTCNIGVLGSACVSLGVKSIVHQISFQYLLPLMALVALCFPKAIGSYVGAPHISNIIFTGSSAAIILAIVILVLINAIKVASASLIHYSNFGPIIYLIVVLGAVNGAIFVTSLAEKIVSLYGMHKRDTPVDEVMEVTLHV